MAWRLLVDPCGRPTVRSRVDTRFGCHELHLSRVSAHRAPRVLVFIRGPASLRHVAGECLEISRRFPVASSPKSPLSWSMPIPLSQSRLPGPATGVHSVFEHIGMPGSLSARRISDWRKAGFPSYGRNDCQFFRRRAGPGLPLRLVYGRLPAVAASMRSGFALECSRNGFDGPTYLFVPLEEYPRRDGGHHHPPNVQPIIRVRAAGNALCKSLSGKRSGGHEI